MAKEENKQVKLTRMYMEFEGVPGESKAMAYRNQVEVLGIHHKITSPFPLTAVPPAEQANVSYAYQCTQSTFQIKTELCHSTAGHMNRLWTQAVTPNAVLTILESDVEVMKIEFKDVVIRRIREHVSSGPFDHDKLPEGVTKEAYIEMGEVDTLVLIDFTYSNMRMIYNTVDENNTKTGTSVVDIDTE